jgi:hypothetical protein
MGPTRAWARTQWKFLPAVDCKEIDANWEEPLDNGRRPGAMLQPQAPRTQKDGQMAKFTSENRESPSPLLLSSTAEGLLH